MPREDAAEAAGRAAGGGQAPRGGRERTRKRSKKGIRARNPPGVPSPAPVEDERLALPIIPISGFQPSRGRRCSTLPGLILMPDKLHYKNNYF